jgi:hypothetical protein
MEFLVRQKKIPQLKIDDLHDFSRAYEEVRSLPPEMIFIREAIELYANSFDVHPSSSLRILGLFAVIELLVTHKPKGTDTGDSLNRQVRTKLHLLANRFVNPFRPSTFFGIENDDLAWEMIYNYRSLIAHGGKVDFKVPFKRGVNSSGAQQLKNEKEVRFFLNEFTRQLLRHALKEPLLISDLKKC